MSPSEELVAQERESLRKYLSDKPCSIESLTGELGSTNLDNLVLGLATMEKLIGNAVQAARSGNMEKATHILGAGVAVQKDGVYMSLLLGYGGMDAFLQRGMTGSPAVLRDYIRAKYEAGVRQCELLLENRGHSSPQ